MLCATSLMAQSYFIKGPAEPKPHEATAIKELGEYLAKRIDIRVYLQKTIHNLLGLRGKSSMVVVGALALIIIIVEIIVLHILSAYTHASGWGVSFLATALHVNSLHFPHTAAGLVFAAKSENCLCAYNILRNIYRVAHPAPILVT